MMRDSIQTCVLCVVLWIRCWTAGVRSHRGSSPSSSPESIESAWVLKCCDLRKV